MHLSRLGVNTLALLCDLATIDSVLFRIVRIMTEHVHIIIMQWHFVWPQRVLRNTSVSVWRRVDYWRNPIFDWSAECLVRFRMYAVQHKPACIFHAQCWDALFCIDWFSICTENRIFIFVLARQAVVWCSLTSRAEWFFGFHLHSMKSLSIA